MAPLNVIMLGGPGSGKSSQCVYIRKQFGLVYISVGNLLWECMQARDALGITVQAYVENGEQVRRLGLH